MSASIKPKKLKRFSIVEALIYNSKGEVLLLKRSKKNSTWINKWQLPGGKVEKNESSLSAIKREIKEESSLGCAGISLDKVFCFKHKFKGLNECICLKVYSCKLSKDPLVLSLDHSSFKFVKLSKIKKFSLTNISKISIFGF
jgi:ADP-ribose pyrophosphatase YjhB (NUDIX family)